MAEAIDDAKRALRETGPLSGPEMIHAVAAACYLMAAADGKVTDEERHRLARTVAQLATAPGQAEGVNEFVEIIANQAKIEDSGTILRQLAAQVRDPQERRNTIAYAAAIAWVDGILDFEEEVLLLDLGEAFGVPPGEVREISERLRQHLRPTR